MKKIQKIMTNPYFKADNTGRVKVLLALAKHFETTQYRIAFTPPYCKWDLEVIAPNGEVIMYIEVKDRWNPSNQYSTAMLNIEKFDGAKDIADKWFYACVYTDDKIIFWKPYAIPPENIKKETRPISTSTVENKPKIPQERLYLSFEDACSAFTNNVIIQFNDGTNNQG